MGDLLNSITKKNLHSPWALLAGIGVGTLFFSAANDLIKEIIASAFIRPALYMVVLLFWVWYWEHYRSCSRKTKKGMIGFVVSIYAENDHEEERLKADFIERLELRLGSEGLSNIIDVNILKNHIAAKTQSHNETVSLNKRLGGRFFIHGKIKRRLNPTSTYFLELNGTVFHAPITQRNSALLKRDIDAVLPRQIQFLEAFEFQGFQYTADAIYFAVRYITGIAAFLSQDPTLAQTLHSNLEEDLKKMGNLPPNLEAVKGRIPLLLSDEAFSVAQAKFNSGHFSEVKEWLKKTFEKNPINYPAMLLQSIVDFQVDNDPLKALARMNKAIKHRGYDNTVFYNLAFLQLWTGAYKDALKSCEKIASSNNDSDGPIIKQSQDFNIALIEQKKFKSQLYFWLGFLSYKKTRNFPEALGYFEKFIVQATSDMDLLLPKASSYLAEVKSVMGVT
ncbi:MAG: hypothetical protein WC030_03550 [Candidatus Paceibacterota bacterium]